MNENQNIMERVQVIEKGISDSKDYRRDAQTQSKIYGQQLEENTQKLIELGTSPNKAEEDVMKIDAEILALVEKIEKMIPFDELKKREERQKTKQD